MRNVKYIITARNIIYIYDSEKYDIYNIITVRNMIHIYNSEKYDKYI